MITDTLRKKTRPIFEQFGVKRAALFGSFAKGVSKPDSDVDILLELKKESTLFDILRLKAVLEKKLGRKVDLVEYDAIKSGLKKHILKYQVPLL